MGAGGINIRNLTKVREGSRSGQRHRYNGLLAGSLELAGGACASEQALLHKRDPGDATNSIHIGSLFGANFSTAMLNGDDRRHNCCFGSLERYFASKVTRVHTAIIGGLVVVLSHELGRSWPKPEYW